MARKENIMKKSGFAPIGVESFFFPDIFMPPFLVFYFTILIHFFSIYPNYHNDPYRAMNFPINEKGNPACPNRKEFKHLYNRPVRENKFGRTEEMFQCADCSNCSHKEKSRQQNCQYKSRADEYS